MKIELTEVLWIDQYQELSLSDLAKLSGLPEAELSELVDCGALEPVNTVSSEWIFDAGCLVVAKTACRLRNDFELDTQGLAVALTLLARIQNLETQLHELRAQLPGRIF
ncbi:MAG: chaperone modulator CbpM [Candidatus Nitrotoga sp.]